MREAEAIDVHPNAPGLVPAMAAAAADKKRPERYNNTHISSNHLPDSTIQRITA